MTARYSVAGTGTITVSPGRNPLANLALITAAAEDSPAVTLFMHFHMSECAVDQSKHDAQPVQLAETLKPKYIVGPRATLGMASVIWRDLHLIVDNYATHKHPKVKAWLNRRPRFHVHFTPTSASWLNMVERFFRDLSQNTIERGVFPSVSELISAIQAQTVHLDRARCGHPRQGRQSTRTTQ